MKKNDSRVIPDDAMLGKEKYVTVSLDRKSFVERMLKEADSSFGKSLDQAAEDVNCLRVEAGKIARKMAEGEQVSTDEMIAAAERARKSYRQLAEIRNKMIEAYREILRKRT